MATFRKVLNIVKNNSFSRDIIQEKIENIINQINPEHIKKYLKKWGIFIGHYFVDEDWFLELLLNRRLVCKKIYIDIIYKHLRYCYFWDEYDKDIIQTFLRVCVKHDFDNHIYFNNIDFYNDTYHNISCDRQGRLLGNYKYLYVNYLHYMNELIFKNKEKTFVVLNEIKQKYKFNTTIYYLIVPLEITFDNKLNNLQQLLDVYLKDIYDKNVLTNYIILSFYNLTHNLLNRTDDSIRKILVDIAIKYGIYNNYIKQQIDKCCSNEYIITSTHMDGDGNISKIKIYTQSELDEKEEKRKQSWNKSKNLGIPNPIQYISLSYDGVELDRIDFDSEWYNIWEKLIYERPTDEEKTIVKYVPLDFHFTNGHGNTYMNINKN